MHFLRRRIQLELSRQYPEALVILWLEVGAISSWDR